MPSLYWISHKGWDCKDDLKLLKYGDQNFELCILPWMWSLNGLFNNLANIKRI